MICGFREQLLGGRPLSNEASEPSGEAIIVGDVGYGSLRKPQKSVIGLQLDLGQNQASERAMELINRQHPIRSPPMPSGLHKCRRLKLFKDFVFVLTKVDIGYVHNLG